VLLGPDVELCRTDYDVAAAAAVARREFAGEIGGDAIADEFADSIMHPPGRAAALETFGRAESEHNQRLAARSMLGRIGGDNRVQSSPGLCG
jgi:hypothetical protein